MSKEYYIYLEARINDEWHCIDGYYYYKSARDGETKLKLATLYENYSRTYFGNTYSELCELSNSIPFSQLSQEIQQENSSWKYVSDIYGEDTDEEACYNVIPLHVFRQHVPTSYQYHGIVHKDDLAAFESEKMDDLSIVDHDLFATLTPEEKSCYSYYEWDSCYDWYYYFKKLNQIIEFEIDKYMSNTWTYDTPEMRLVIFDW